jgi:hypothetical protein
MVLVRLVDFFTNQPSIPGSGAADHEQGSLSVAMEETAGNIQSTGGTIAQEEVDHEAARPPYIHVGVHSDRQVLILEGLANATLRQCLLEELGAQRATC